MHFTDFVLVVTVDVAVENCNVVVGRENIHHLVSVAGEPLPIGPEIKEGPVRKYHNRGGLRESRQIRFQPSQLFGADLRFGTGNVVERDEVHAAMVERVMTVAEEFAVEGAAVKTRVVFTGDVLNQGHVQLFRNLLKLLHALHVDISVFGVMCKIAGEENEVRPLGQRIDHVDGALEGLCAQWVRRAIESNVGVTELHERKRSCSFAVAAAQGSEYISHLALGQWGGVGGIAPSDAERSSSDL